MKKAIVLVSGGLDSATCLAIAQAEGYACYALSFDYGQRSVSELSAAARLAEAAGVVAHKTLPIDMGAIGGSALTDRSIAVPEQETQGIPVTYVPARNTVFLSYALAWAEVVSAEAIFIGVNALDYSGYPDCRPEYINAFQSLIDLATKAGVEGKSIALRTPLIDLTKAEIIDVGLQLGVDYAVTVSCYQADEDGRACGRCDSCRLRKKGFADAQSEDPTRYR
ncbi:MAG: 7-cyano-7-deazaguanine synthase QueC [Proteobacteria bacterium]|jgi:7-cyano-7-deazaguanine synthase|nr:7-cyano-7-deazaguanine synthase QueC [Pseudomonadales bacterium]MDA0805288.1 7-cyano-7-deazaguanine synthase QueC [Pseudomonadota bacterium]MDA0896853.1 7-cyano-7-deazaguanine synthase QueC [Pseudomonadota bacterium]MDA1244181.1 7-cyano-7-deazaguanine synthase QueC [Pseudomonadota bacterium]